MCKILQILHKKLLTKIIINSVFGEKKSQNCLVVGRKSVKNSQTTPAGRTHEGESTTRAWERKNATRDNKRKGAKTGNAIGIDGRHGAIPSIFYML